MRPGCRGCAREESPAVETNEVAAGGRRGKPKEVEAVAPESDDVVLNYREAAKFLGVSERTLERYVRESRIPYVRFPQRGERRAVVRFLRSQLLQWLRQRTVRAARPLPRSPVEGAA
jgi:excisionase family DNA binding protein